MMANDDRFGELEELSSWELVNDDQDIRGWPVLSPNGNDYGTVEDMLVDKEKEHVAAVRLSDNRLVATDNLEIRDNDVVYHNDRAAARIVYAKVRRPRT